MKTVTVAGIVTRFSRGNDPREIPSSRELDVFSPMPAVISISHRLISTQTANRTAVSFIKPAPVRDERAIVLGEPAAGSYRNGSNDG